MKLFSLFNFDLGMRNLFPEWKALFSRKYFYEDFIAGITVAFVAIPLSLAIALASGVTPGMALVTAIVAGIVCALFGSAPLSISGPAAAMAVLISASVESFGITGLVLITFSAGCMQLLSGVFGIGRLARYVPLPVIAGFTAGIGVIIIMEQLPRAIGLLPAPESDKFRVLLNFRDYYEQINYACLMLVILTLLIIRFLPKIFPRLPPSLPAVAIATAIVYFFQLKTVPLIGSIPNSLPAPALPDFSVLTFKKLIINSFAIYLLASLETLLSSTATDKLTNAPKHDPNQELVAQGLGNVAVSLFGGMPVTSVIARSAINVQAGAKTRRASIIHSLIMLLTIACVTPLISIIPIPALVAVLFSIAYSKINYREFWNLWKTSRPEGIVYAITFLAIISIDLVAGIQLGIAAAVVFILIKASRTKLTISSAEYDNVIRLSIQGSLTFFSASELEELEKPLASAKPGQTVILDLSTITDLDSSGAHSVIELFKACGARQLKFYITGLPQRFEPLLGVWDDNEIIMNHMVVSENELRTKDFSSNKSSRGRLLYGVSRFYADSKDNKRLFETLAIAQDPHTIFITCSDSRIIPSMITSSDPGELFIVRNVGNYIPPYLHDNDFSEGAALEFALNHLNISDIVVCGHASCGAIKACMGDGTLTEHLQAWIQRIKSQLKIPTNASVDDVAKLNILNQMENLTGYPVIQQKLADKSILIHGWFFDFDERLVYEWDKMNKAFKVIE